MIFLTFWDGKMVVDGQAGSMKEKDKKKRIKRHVPRRGKREGSQRGTRSINRLSI